MKLKTLEEIEKEPEWSQKVFDAEGIYISPFRLKQEAIKWIKEHDWIYDAENDKGHDLPDELNLTHVDKEFQIICKWIKHFFNISEEDLK